MLPWMVYQMNELRRHELEREAEERKGLLPGQVSYRVNPRYAPLLAKLGRGLVSLGGHLQEQYEARGSLVVKHQS